MAERLKESLDLYHMDTLKEIAEYLHLTPGKAPTRKAWLIDQVYEGIRDFAKSPSLLSVLSEAERAVLGILLHNGGDGTQRDVVLPLMMAGLIYVDGQASSFDKPKVQNVLLSLLRRGLIINLSDLVGTSSRRTFDPLVKFGIAPEILILLPRKQLPFPEPQTEQQQVKTPPHIERVDPEQCLRQLFFMWAELRRAPGQQLKSGGMSKRDARRVAASIGLDIEHDEEHFTWLLNIQASLNLITETASEITAVNNAAVTLFWNASPQTQMFNILQSYTNTTASLHLDMRNLLQFGYYSTISTRPPADVRAQILNLLKETANSQWFPFPTFLSFLTAGRAGSMVLTEYALNALYSNLRWYGAGRRESLDAALQQLDQQVVVTVLKELQALGAVELGYPAPGSVPSALQTTPLVRSHLTNRPAPVADIQGQVILQPDFQLLAMGPVPLHILANLERFAEREKLNESVVTYRITRDGAYQALQRGETPESIQLFLEEATGQPVPQNIARTLEEWGEQYERIVVRRNIAILQTDSTEMLDNLLSDQAIRKHLHRLDDHTAWIHTKHAERVEARLWELEALPTFSRGPQADIPRSLRWDDGHLRPRHPLPSLYVTGTVRRIAEETAGQWQLTPKSVRAAAATGMDIPAIIALLEQMTGAKLDTEWQKTLKAWGNHYGDGQAARALLLRFDNDEALQELRRADRRLGRWIRPLPGAAGIGIVDDSRWEEAQALLSEWGINVEDKPWW